MSVSDLYTRPIEQVDCRAKLYRQCEAMLGVLSNRSALSRAAIDEHIGLLDTGIEARNDIPIRDLIRLHRALAEGIKPELPQSAELLQWESVRPKKGLFDLKFLAPVSAIRKVMVFAIICFVVFFLILIFGPLTHNDVVNGIPLFNKNSSEAAELVCERSAFSCFLLEHAKIINLTFFYVSLSAIGACFATLYTANSFVSDGSYDPRHGSSYAIRIGLGMIAGFLLSQVIPGSATGGNGDLVLFGRAVLALLGGFAGDLVHGILQKLVHAVETIFQENPRDMIARMRHEAEQREQTAMAQHEAKQAANMMGFAAQFHSATDPGFRTELVNDFLKRMGVPPNTDEAKASDPGRATLDKAEALAGFLRRMLEVLPPNEGKPVRDKLTRLEQEIARVRGIANRGDFLTAAAKLAVEITSEPLQDLLADSLGKFKLPLAALGITPAGLTLSIVTMAVQTGSEAYRRWKARVLNTPYDPRLLPVDLIDTTAIKAALSAHPNAQTALQPPMGNMAMLNQLGGAIVDLDPAAFYQRFGQNFKGTPQEFETAVAPLRAALQKLRNLELDRAVSTDIPDQVLTLSGAADRKTILQSFDALQNDPASLAAMERLFLMAGAARDADTTDGDLQRLVATINSAATQGAGQP
ncbi:hypothetical protein [Paracoccus laeviglucosivorans]|uniref:Uncharacterized protein n=1 Tax=Paracoccus laeviglucosivorans TaxID=1197861 RepID=A0A521FCS7_9RHOB|nr:hypothetical protein [Paracoccus laeviglucosivorans]SMO93998.1 hypothetical protein SAMN06265221_12057 [Paracoccus laeviglucosivorans]